MWDHPACCARRWFRGAPDHNPDGGSRLIHHSDAGSRYTALACTEELREAGIVGSIGTVGDALDNALMESTIGLYSKTEIPAFRSSTQNWSGLREVESEVVAQQGAVA